MMLKCCRDTGASLSTTPQLNPRPTRVVAPCTGNERPASLPAAQTRCAGGGPAALGGRRDAACSGTWSIIVAAGSSSSSPRGIVTGGGEP